MQNHAIYLYGIIPEDFEKELDILGIDQKNKLYIIQNKELKAVTSNVPLEEFGEKAFARNVENMDWLKQKAVLHSDIITQIFTIAGLIVPVKFGTVYLLEENVRNFLQEYSEALKENISNLKGTEEWGVKLYCDINKFIDTSMAEEKESVLEQTSQVSKGAGYFMKKKLSGSIEESAKDKIIKFSQDIYNNISSQTYNAKLNKILSREATGLPYEMYMNAVLLINKENIVCFKQLVQQYISEYESKGIFIEQSGPWPPYNFCNLGIIE